MWNVLGLARDLRQAMPPLMPGFINTLIDRGAASSEAVSAFLAEIGLPQADLA